MPFKVGVTSGLYTIARGEELATAVKKLGYTLTRGTSAVELAGDVPHEITETDGGEIRHIAGKQGLELTFHGSLTVPIGIPERGDWRDAHDHMQKSVRSAVHCGCAYTNFHSCLNIWLELMTYAGRKLTMSFCDHEGNFITKILKENARLRSWFIKKRGDMYLTDIFDRDRRVKLNSAIQLATEKWRKEQQEARLRELLERELDLPPDKKADLIGKLVIDALASGVAPRLTGADVLNKKIVDLWDEIRKEASLENAKIEERNVDEALERFLKKGEKWYTEEMRAVVGIIDGYHIMAHHLFYTKDPIWVEMVNVYSKELEKYKMDYTDELWLDNAWEKAESENDRGFKEFYYSVVGAKFLEGHTKKLLDWLEGDYVKKELKDKPELLKIAEKIQICYETPDARDPSHAGLFLLWRPKQVYAAIKVIRRVLKTDRVWLLMDFEHVATQGLDALKEMEETAKNIPDFGEYILAVHSNAPNPLHAHEPIEVGNVIIYKLLWSLRKTGFGKRRKAFVFFERGGGKDPFQQSVEALRLAVRYLDQDVPPKELPVEYFGMKGPVAGGEQRQRQIVRDHAWEPLKDLLEMPEEEWTMLSQAAIKKGKKPEAWKKGEFR